MTAIPFDPDWLAGLHARAQQAARSPRLPLLWDGWALGSVDSALLPALFAQQPHWQHGAQPADSQQLPSLRLCVHAGQSAWQLQGAASASDALNALALALRQTGLGGVERQWRDEQLAVCDADGQVRATVERGAVRALGIATRAVHLVGRTPSGQVWVQQRALTKSSDPGKWDTLVGGMVPASDDVAQALARETWEEAGLHLQALEHLRWACAIQLARPGVSHSGYLLEHVDCYVATLPDSLQPTNQDGEVLQFACLPIDALQSMLQNDAFTLEAALLLVRCLDPECSVPGQ